LTRRDTNLAGKIESEVVLIIRDHAEKTAQTIANLSTMLDNSLAKRRSFTIRDTYFDTKSKFFTRNKITFRVRQSSHKIILSSKSSPRRIAIGGTRRVEIENPWSYQSLASLTGKYGLEPPNRELFRLLPRSPSRLLTEAGFEIIQERLTRRKSRDLIALRKNKPLPFAELSIDDVTYFSTKGPVRLVEIEIEAKAAGAMLRIRSVVDFLISEYPALQVWPHGKFVTGLAIEKLLKKRRSIDLTRGNLLKAGMFRPIDRAISGGSALTSMNS